VNIRGFEFAAEFISNSQQLHCALHIGVDAPEPDQEDGFRTIAKPVAKCPIANSFSGERHASTSKN
jgi:hypothetical protein